MQTPVYRYKSVSVEPGKKAVLVNINASPGSVIDIEHIGHSFFDNEVEFKLVFDGKVWLRWDHQLGQSSPGPMYELPEPLTVTKSLRLVVVNKSKDTRLYSGSMDGVLHKI